MGDDIKMVRPGIYRAGDYLIKRLVWAPSERESKKDYLPWRVFHRNNSDPALARFRTLVEAEADVRERSEQDRDERWQRKLGGDKPVSAGTEVLAHE